MQDLQQIKGIVTSIQKAMQKRGYSTKTQWDDLTISPADVMPKSAFLQRLSLYGINLSNNEVRALWNYFDIQPHSIRYDDFANIMGKTFPSPYQDESRVSYNSGDYLQSRPFTTSASQRSAYQTSSQRPYTTTQRTRQMNLNPQSSQQDVIRRSRNIDPEDDYQYEQSHIYNSSKTIKEREIRTVPYSDIRTLDTLSNSSIQRQNFDDTPKKSFKSRTPLKRTLATISDCAYSSDPSSWSCFLKWRDPTKDTIDAQDLINAIQKDHKIQLNLADVQRVIDKYGPLNQMTFKLMLTEGSRYSLYKDFDDDDYDF